MLWNWYFRLTYRLAPAQYLRLAKLHYQKRNPRFLAEALAIFGAERWPLLLWVFGNQYLQRGGQDAFPRSRGFEHALLTDAAARDRCPGPIQMQVERWRQEGTAALEGLATPEGQIWLNKLVRPIRSRDDRLAGLLDRKDLMQEALLRLQEVSRTPWIQWPVVKRWPEAKHRATLTFARDLLARISARKYDSDTQGEREKVYLDEEIALPDSFDSRELEQVEDRDQVERLLAELPAKQREAAEVHLQAKQLEVSLEEMSRRLGRDPKRDRENFKAVQRRFRK